MLEHVSIPFNVLVEVTVRIVCIICIAQSTFNALFVGLIRLCCFCRLSGLLEFSVWHVILVLLKPGTLEKRGNAADSDSGSVLFSQYTIYVTVAQLNSTLFRFLGPKTLLHNYVRGNVISYLYSFLSSISWIVVSKT